MSFPIDGTIPAANNDPADDQPIMKSNFLNTKNYLSVDHVNPGTPGDGFHKQITFQKKTTQAAQSGQQSVLYTDAAISSTDPQLYWKNLRATYPISAIKAFGKIFIASNGTPSFSSQSTYNVVSASFSSPRTWLITLTANAANNFAFPIILVDNGAVNLSSYSYLTNVITVSVNPAVSVAFNFDFIMIGL